MEKVKLKARREGYRIAIMAVLLLVAFFLTWYFHAKLGIDTVFTHFFYIPIILASLWWKRKGLVVAIFLAVFLISSHIFFEQDVVAIDDYLRASLFVVVGLVVAILSERILKTEKEMQAYAQDLVVMNKQLKVETKRAKESDRLKSEFLANMSHEIRTPLTAINGASYLLDESSISSEQRKLNDIIAQSGERLLELINDILDLARIEAGQVKLEGEEFSLRETLKKLIPGFELEAEEKEIELDLIYSDSLPSRIVSDEGKLIQILSNLITNALKFTEKGKVEVRLESLADSKIQVFIEDTGIGIPKEKLPHIFNKFYQVDGTLTRKYQGTGLGLTIANGLVDVLGGEIEVQSTLGEGSTFSFSFPYQTVEEKVELIARIE